MRDSKISTILSLCFSGPGNPYDVCAAVRKEHKKFYKCKSEQAKEKWHPRRMALARLGVFFGNKALSLPAFISSYKAAKNFNKNKQCRSLPCQSEITQGV